MEATLWRMAERPTVTEEDGTERPATDRELLNMGLKIVGVLPDGTEIVHAEPGLNLSQPAFTQIFARGWSWNDVPETVRDHVLVAVYEVTVDGEAVRRRSKVADVPEDATLLETDRPPHFWFGDES